MFDQLPSSGHRSSSSTLLISLTVHLAVLAIVVVAPLVYYQQLEWTSPEIPAVLWTPPSPPPPPPTRNPVEPAPRPSVVQISELIPPPPGAILEPAPPTGIVLPTSSLRNLSPLGSNPPVAGGAGPPGIVVAETAGPPPPPPPPAPRQPVRLSSIDTAQLVHRVDPVYPPLARRSRVEGVVVLQLLIDRQGEVREVTLVRGHPLLNRAAIEAVRQWRYRPTRLNDEPVEVYATVTVQFKLR